MNYNEIKLSIFESFENGEIDEIEKDILLERLEEKFNEEDNNTFSNLYEATAQVKQVKKLEKELEKLNKDRTRLGELCYKFDLEGNKRMSQNVKQKIKNVEKKIFDIVQKIGRIDPGAHAITSKNIGDGYAFNQALGRKHGTIYSYGPNTAERLAEAKNAVRSNPWRGKSKRTEREPGRYKTTKGLKECVEESYINGSITEEQMDTFLEYLDY